MCKQVDLIFKRFPVLFAKWDVQFQGSNMDDVKQEWARHVSKFPVALIDSVIDGLVENKRRTIPTIADFVALCKRSKTKKVSGYRDSSCRAPGCFLASVRSGLCGFHAEADEHDWVKVSRNLRVNTPLIKKYGALSNMAMIDFIECNRDGTLDLPIELIANESHNHCKQRFWDEITKRVAL